MTEEREILIADALRDCERLPLYEAARRNTIPRGTLRHRNKGGTTARRAKEKNQKLTKKEEEGLISWIENEEAAGWAPTKKDTHTFA